MRHFERHPPQTTPAPGFRPGIHLHPVFTMHDGARLRPTARKYSLHRAPVSGVHNIRLRLPDDLSQRPNLCREPAAFLPQAYVNDFGNYVAPAVCVHAASAYFPLSSIHPTVGSYHGQRGWMSPQQYAPLLAAAGTTGFSVYNAETNMSAQSWQAYGQAIRQQGIAVRVS